MPPRTVERRLRGFLGRSRYAGFQEESSIVTARLDRKQVFPEGSLPDAQALIAEGRAHGEGP